MYRISLRPVGQNSQGHIFQYLSLQTRQIESMILFFGVAKLLKENHYTQGYVYEWGDFFYFRVSFPKKGRTLLGRSPHQGLRGCVIIGYHSAFDGYSIKINPLKNRCTLFGLGNVSRKSILFDGNCREISELFKFLS